MLRRCLWKSCKAAAGSLSRVDPSCCEQSSAGVASTNLLLFSPSNSIVSLRSWTSGPDRVSRDTGVDNAYSGRQGTTDIEQSNAVEARRSPLSDIFPSDSDEDEAITEDLLASDDFLDRWQDLLEKDDFKGIHRLIRSKFDPSSMPTFEDLLSAVLPAPYLK